MNRRAFCLSAAAATMPVVALAQPPKKEPDGPAAGELRKLRDADQADRQFAKPPTDDEWKPIAERDRKRRERVRQLLDENKVVTGEDFDIAFLIFQHGESPEDYQLAHELAIIAGSLGKFGNGPALSEDRFLQSIKRRQRFGSQFSKDGSAGEMPDTSGPTAVTDTLRLDAFEPPLDLVKQYGLQANQKAMDRLFARVEKRMDRDWQKKQAALPEAKSLRQRAEQKPTQADVTYALDLYHADKLNTAGDYYNAARILSSERSGDFPLLTHELAVIAVMRRYAPAHRFVAWTWDRFLVSIGRPQRFGLVTERIVDGKPQPEVASPGVTDGMRAKLGLLPLKQLIPSTINPAKPKKE